MVVPTEGGSCIGIKAKKGKGLPEVDKHVGGVRDVRKHLKCTGGCGFVKRGTPGGSDKSLLGSARGERQQIHFAPKEASV